MTTYTTPGSHSHTVPSSGTIVIRCWGAQGQNGSGVSVTGSGAPGGFAEIEISPGDVTTSSFDVNVGGQNGTNGGGSGGSVGNASGGNGGGASDVRDGTTLSDRIAVGGGGGGGAATVDGNAGSGGQGGADQGEGGGSPGDASGGGGGDQTSGGSAGAGGNVTAGSEGSGGDGGADSFDDRAGGGGGGGYYGGGGGGTGDGNDYGGGGGGSNFTDQTVAVEISNDRGIQTGNGQVEIVTKLEVPQNVSATTTGTDSIDVSWDGSQSETDEYHVYRHTSSGAYNNGSVVATVTDDGSASYTYADTGLSIGTQYFYQIVAVDTDQAGFVNSDPSTEVSATTQSAKHIEPSAVTLTISNPASAVTVSGVAEITHSETTLTVDAIQPGVSGAGTITVAPAATSLSLDTFSANAFYHITPPPTELTLDPPAFEIDADAWEIDNYAIDPRRGSLTLTPRTISIGIDADADTIDHWRQYDRAGDVRVPDGYAGAFRAIDRAGRADAVRVEPKADEMPPVDEADYYVNSYEEQQVASGRYEVALTLQRARPREDVFSAPSESGEYELATGHGTLGLGPLQVGFSDGTGTATGGKRRLILRLTDAQAGAIADALGHPGAIVRREVSDGEDELVDESGGDQTVTLSTPSGSTIPGGDYYVQDWVSSLDNFSEYRWRAELTVAEKG